MVLIAMKPLALISALALCWSLAARAQGVHLAAGDTLSIGFSRFDGCYPFDGPADTAVRLVFGNDLLEAGDSIRLDMLADTLDDPPFKTAVFSPAQPTPTVQLTGPYTGWLDRQGYIRVNMLSGSADIDYARFFLEQGSTYCDAVVVVSEPGGTTLFVILGTAMALTWAFMRRRSRSQHASLYHRLTSMRQTVTLIPVLVFCYSLPAVAQGVHLAAGDTLLVGFSRFDGCHPLDAGADTVVIVSFGNDLIGSGDSMRLEMLADTPDDPPFKTAVFSPTAPTAFVQLNGPYTGWLDRQGFARVSMLSGSVDVESGHFFLDMGSSYCDAFVVVPEPRSTTLFALLGVAMALTWAFMRRRSGSQHSSLH